MIPSKDSSHVISFLIEMFQSFGLKENEQPSHKTFYLRSDRGGEFITPKVTECCMKYGFIKKVGPAYSPWCQGVVERANQTLKVMMNTTLMNDNSLDQTKIFESIVQQYNNIYYRIIDMNPYKAWNNTFYLDLTNITVEQRLLRNAKIKKIK